MTYEQFPNHATLFRPVQIRDSNGNYISIVYRTDGWAEGQEIDTITDTVGRVITFNYDATTHTLTSVSQGGTTYATFHWNNSYALQYNFTVSVRSAPSC